eukprot:scaffold54661_cov67-Phaeocystis_antarctica.AAC.5
MEPHIARESPHRVVVAQLACVEHPVEHDLSVVPVGRGEQDEVVLRHATRHAHERAVASLPRLRLMRRPPALRLHEILAVDVRLAPEAVALEVALARTARPTAALDGVRREPRHRQRLLVGGTTVLRLLVRRRSVWPHLTVP